MSHPQPQPRTLAVAIIASLVLHVVVAAVFALLLVLSPLFGVVLPRPPTAEPVELTIAMPEILIPEENPVPEIPEEEEEEPAPPEEFAELPEEPDAGNRARDIFRTTQNEREAVAPENARFQSDRNTTAASEAEAVDDPENADMPSQDGEDLPFLELARREYVDGELADDATRGDDGPEDPSPASPLSVPEMISALQPPSPLPPSENPQEPVEADGDAETEESPDEPSTGQELVARATPPPMSEPIRDLLTDPAEEPIPFEQLEPMDEPEEVEEPLTIREPFWETDVAEAAPAPRRVDETALAEAPPAATPPSEPRPQPGDPNIDETDIFQPHTPKTHFRGGIGQKGRAAVGAEDTPVGRYGKAVTQAVERTWHLYRMSHSDFVTYATIRLSFQVNRQGRPENLKIIENDANAIMTDFTLNAILDASIPAIPPDVAELLDEGKFNITYDVIVY